MLPVIVTGPDDPVRGARPGRRVAADQHETVLPVIVSGPVIVAPQIRTTLAPVAVIGPVIMPPSMSSDPPALTVTGPACEPPAPMQIASPALTVSGPARVVGEARARVASRSARPGTNVENV